MNELYILYKKLELYKNFDKNPSNYEIFLETVNEIILIKDPESIPVLFSYFNDKSEYSWVMEELMLYLEQYQTKDLLNALAKNPLWYWQISPLRTRGLLMESLTLLQILRN